MFFRSTPATVRPSARSSRGRSCRNTSANTTRYWPCKLPSEHSWTKETVLDFDWRCGFWEWNISKKKRLSFWQNSAFNCHWGVFIVTFLLNAETFKCKKLYLWCKFSIWYKVIGKNYSKVILNDKNIIKWDFRKWLIIQKKSIQPVLDMSCSGWNMNFGTRCVQTGWMETWSKSNLLCIMGN